MYSHENRSPNPLPVNLAPWNGETMRIRSLSPIGNDEWLIECRTVAFHAYIADMERLVMALMNGQVVNIFVLDGMPKMVFTSQNTGYWKICGDYFVYETWAEKFTICPF